MIISAYWILSLVIATARLEDYWRSHVLYNCSADMPETVRDGDIVTHNGQLIENDVYCRIVPLPMALRKGHFSHWKPVACQNPDLCYVLSYLF